MEGNVNDTHRRRIKNYIIFELMPYAVYLGAPNKREDTFLTK